MIVKTWNMSIKRVGIGVVKSVELLKDLPSRCFIGFDGEGLSKLMTLGRFLLFFVAGLAVAIAFPPMSWLMWPLAVLAGIVVVSLIRR